MNATVQWYNTNEGRAYPLNEYSTQQSADGSHLDREILVDAGIMVPPEYKDIYLSSVRITAAIVTISFSSATTGLLVCTLPRSSVRPYVAYPLTGLVSNISGWVVFGSFSGTCDLRFNNAEQSGLEQRAVHIVNTIPVTGVKKYRGSELTLDKVIKLKAGPHIELLHSEYYPQKLTVRLRSTSKHMFTSPCSGIVNDKDRCWLTPIRSINGVCADSNGVITLRFE